MFSVVASNTTGSRAKLLLHCSSSSASATAIAAMVMVEQACSKSAVFLRQLLRGVDSSSTMLLSRALIFTCCCSWCTQCSSKAHSPISSSKNVGKTNSLSRQMAFRGPVVSSRGGNSNVGSHSMLLSPPLFRRSNVLASKKRLFSSSSSNSGEQEATTLLSVEVLADKLANAEFSSIIALVGAGASCSAGIPDFRTPGTGLYDKLGKYDLPVPEAIFDLDYYTKTTPLPFVDLCHSIWPGQETGPKPTPTHHFLKLLEEKQLLGRIYTQNIDGLEALAGISTDKLVECHGHFRSASCVNRKCKHKMPIEDCRKAMVGEGNAPVCQKCGSLVKPDIVFFGEEMPSRFQELIDKDMDHCDLLLVFGTSLLVMPVAGIPSWVAPICPRVLFNLEPAWGIGIGGGRGRRQQRDDLFLQGDCDDSVQTVCDLAGWKEDLETITPLRATSN